MQTNGYLFMVTLPASQKGVSDDDYPSADPITLNQRHFCNRIAKKFGYGCIRVSSIVYICILLSTVVFTYRGCEIVGYGSFDFIVQVVQWKITNRLNIYLVLNIPLWECSVEHSACSE